MAYTIPNFNITADVYDAAASPAVAVYRLTTPCNLQFARKVNPGSAASPANTPVWEATIFLLVPALTDIRDRFCPGSEDWVEVPSGTGRWYRVVCVDDVGKGFPNEYRVAILCKDYGWPQPIP